MTPASRLIEWMETLEVTEGPREGERFRVLPWQRRFLRSMMRRDVTTAALSVARGNGKTTLLAALASAMLAGPLRRRGGLVLAISATIEQARIAATHVERFLQALEGDLVRRDGWSVTRYGTAPRIKHRPSSSELRCQAAIPTNLHGFAPALVLLDEPAQWRTSVSREVLEVLRTSTGKVDAKIVALGTRAADDSTWWARWCRGEDVDYSQVHAANPRLPPGHRRTWERANPSLKWFPLLEQRLRDEWQLARRDPDALASFNALRLNRGVRPVEEAVLIDAEAWARCEVHADILPPVGNECRPQVWGIDVGSSEAMSAVCRYDVGSMRLDVLAAFPREPDLGTRGLRDGVGNLYRKMEAEGDLIQTGGRATDYLELIEEAKKRFGWPDVIVADRWRAPEFADALARAGMASVPGKLRGTGWRDGGQDVEGFRRSVNEGMIVAGESLLLRSALMEARVIMDGAGNAKLAKMTEGGRRKRARDDAAAAAILAVAEGARLRKIRPLGLPRLLHVGAP